MSQSHTTYALALAMQAELLRQSAERRLSTNAGRAAGSAGAARRRTRRRISRLRLAHLEER